MKNILYIGNKLHSKKRNVSSIDTLVPLLEKEGYTLYYASSQLNKVLRLLEMLMACLRYRQRVDVVIIDTYSTLNFYYALFVSQLCRILNLKYIPSLNGGNLLKRLRENPFLCRLIFNHAYKNVSPSLFLKQAFEDFGYTNIDYIPNSIELEHYPFKERSFAQVNLFWVRSFSIIYNPLLAVRVLKVLRDDGIDASLCMVGPDSDGTLKQTKKLAKQLDVNVKFPGKLSKPEWIKLAQDYNIFINTTNFDNMPVSVVEGMALGMVVISTNVGGMPYLIDHGHDGILIEPDNVNAFVNAIKHIMREPEMAHLLGVHARHKVEQFDWNVIKHLWFKALQ
ncbi:glycosyltransferase family 4 protein [Yeosuana sp. MJ-SS3]|uniref:Glycosyltransferase family 4 protein n=1 Tax=Gilvirhabdus luticola TaxID=3079858 RepID=A0ABU3U4W6_9FLAO|nr:glycosyltransferase family 4 protein [Yeosuana sp. MJ-SS3]MDU8885455.1 glycosyltransferase family 4 protein [Yeosuana sp. MJ-SS3]